jgi:hypothetical protein
MDSWRATRILTATGAAAAVLALGVAGGAAHATSVPDPAAPPSMAGQSNGLGTCTTAAGPGR